MIKKTSLYQLNNNVLNTLVTRLLVAIKAVSFVNNGTTAKIIADVSALNDKLTKSLNTSLKSEHSEILKALDLLRDDAFRAIRDAILACSRRLNETYRLNAQKLLKIFKSHGWSLWKENYQEESAKMNSLLLELRGEEAKAAIAAISLTEWFEELEKSEDDFEDAFQNKASNDLRKEYIAVAKIRPDLIKNTNDLLEQINLDAKYSPKPGNYTELVKTINNILEEASILAKSAKTRKTNDIDEVAGE